MFSLDVLNNLLNLNKVDSYVCLKQRVNAIIVTKDNYIIFGTNNINNKIDICPRANSKSGEDYHFCKDICNQNAHAEVDAINNALKNNIDINDSTLYLIGHTYCCNNCLENLNKYNIKNIIIHPNFNLKD